MKKNKTKSLLTCAVLASLMAGVSFGSVSEASLSGNQNLTNLTIAKDEDFHFTSVNYTGARSYGFFSILCEGITVTDSLDWANVLNVKGSITLKGSFSVANDTLTLERPTNVPNYVKPEYMYYQQGLGYLIQNWNDITYNGSQSVTLHVRGRMHGLVVNGGTFTAENNLTLDDYLKINNGATVNVKEYLYSPNAEINGTLSSNRFLRVNGFWHMYQNSKITLPDRVPINVYDTLKLEQDANIVGECVVFRDGKLDVVGNCSIKKLNFLDGSTLQVDGNNIQSKPAITYTTDVSGANKFKLIINNQKEGVEYKIVEKKPLKMLMNNGLGTPNSTPDLEEIVWPEYGMIVDLDNSQFDNSWSVTFKKDPELPEYSDIPNIITGLINKKDSIPWIQELTNKFQTYPDKELYLEALNNTANTLANLNSLANVQTGLRTMSSLVADSIQENAGLRGKDSGFRTEGQGKYDKQVWASIIHSKEKVEGRKTGHLEQNSTLQYNGVVVGADLWKGEHGFGGVALSYGDGNFHSSQMVTGVRNEADYYGISVYNRQDVGKFSFVYDGGLTYGKNDVTLINYWDENITAKPKAMAYNVGFKVEEPIKLSKATELTPFAGLRYAFIKTKDYTDNCADGYAADNQHLVNLPIGLTLKGTYETKEGWTLGGSLTGGYNWNLGNRNSTQSMEYAGFSDSMNFDIADRGEYFVKAGLTAECRNLAFELGYRYSKGDTVRDNRWNVNVNWAF